jgi:hypothetical protein
MHFFQVDSSNKLDFRASLIAYFTILVEDEKEDTEVEHSNLDAIINMLGIEKPT